VDPVYRARRKEFADVAIKYRQYVFFLIIAYIVKVVLSLVVGIKKPLP